MPARFLIRLVALTTVSIFGSAHGAVFTVGSDPQCTHNTVQAAIDAAEQMPTEPHTIRIATNQTYTAQALTIRGVFLVTIEGGFSDCSDLSPSGNTVISGQGGAQASVLHINGGFITLRNLSFIRGDESMVNGRGGGIKFTSPGVPSSLGLHGVVISQNSAAFGGGLHVTGGTVTIGSGTQIAQNTAQFSGGGILVRGRPGGNYPRASLEMQGDDTVVINNQALGIDTGTGQPSGGYGGGILVESDVEATLRFDGPGGLGGNTARYGGGIAVRNLGGEGTDIAVRVGGADIVRIANNSAIVAGGGIWVEGIGGGAIGSDVEVCLSNFLFEGNTAPSGAAIHAGLLGTSAGDDPSQARVALNRPCLGATPGPNTPTAPPCTRAGSCNRIIGHTGNPSSLLRFGPGASLDAQRVVFVGNTAQRLVDADEPGAVSLTMCLATANTLGASVLRARNPQDLVTLAECTIADNTNAGSYLLEFPNGGALALRNGIFWQPGELLVSPAGGGAGLNASVLATISNDRSTLPGLPGFIDGPPAFNDPVVGDYRPRASSPAIDVAATTGGTDLVFKPRDQRILPTAGSTRDIGAYERQTTDPLLINGSFYGGFSQWVVRGNPWVTYDAANNDGADGTGAATLFIPLDPGAGIPQIEVLAQCFAVPFPGTYRLGARAIAPGTMQTRDVPKLAWRLRMGSSTCTGATQAGGETFFPGSGGAWASATPVDVVVPSAGFGQGTTIEIVAVVAQSAIAAGALSARFDNFTVNAVAGAPLADPIFGNGFEAP